MARRKMRLDAQAPAHILMLVPYDPEENPQVRRSMEMGDDVGRTHVIVYSESDRCLHEYDGRLYVERVDRRYLDTDEYKRSRKCVHPFEAQHRLHRLLKPITDSGSLRRLLYRRAQAGRSRLVPVDPSAHGSWPQRWSRMQEALLDYYEDRETFDRCLALLRRDLDVAETLYTRGRALSVVPRLIVCHDAPALLAAVRLKHEFGCPVLYDCHEAWPEALAEGRPWLSELKWHMERQLIRHADRVVTARPLLAGVLERWYGVEVVTPAPGGEYGQCMRDLYEHCRAGA